jgi:hypothetical protein
MKSPFLSYFKIYTTIIIKLLKIVLDLLKRTDDWYTYHNKYNIKVKTLFNNINNIYCQK